MRLEKTKSKTLGMTLLVLSLLETATVPAQTKRKPNPAPTATVQNSKEISIARRGSRPSRSGPAENFTGEVTVNPLFEPQEPSRMLGAYVTFEPGARTAWHSHPVGQTLIVTSGTGRVQLWGATVDEIKTGDVVRIPPNAKHWHGAAPDSSMTHLAIVEELNKKTSDWMEKVTDAQYNAPVRAEQPRVKSGKRPRSFARSIRRLETRTSKPARGIKKPPSRASNI